MALVRSANPDEAGRKYGYRAKEGSEPWTFAVAIDGKIVAAETTSRAATISVDTGGDGKIAAIVQIGPAMRGTALRDALDFVSFNDFKNQIDYAQFGKAFNQHVVQGRSCRNCRAIRSSGASVPRPSRSKPATSRRWSLRRN